MRLFIASAIFHPDSGGPATYLFRLLPALQARGHQIRVLTFGEPTAQDSSYPYPLRRVSLRLPLPQRWRLFRALYEQELHQADLIYVNLLGLPRGGDRKLPRVLKVVGDLAWERAVNRGWLPPTTDIDQFQRQRYSPIVEFLKAGRAWEVRHVDRVIVPSRYLREMVIGWGAPPDRVQVIYNALETAQYNPTLDRDSARTELQIAPETPILLTAARLTTWKGIDLLLDALAHPSESKQSEWHLLVAGDGPQQSALEAQTARLGLSHRVTFLGKVPHDRLGIYMRAADYFVLYSGYEGLSHVILEALSAGLPVIASDRGGNPELVQDGVNGLNARHPDVAALRAVLNRAADPELRGRLAANTRIGLASFDWDKLVMETNQALEDVLATYRR